MKLLFKPLAVLLAAAVVLAGLSTAAFAEKPRSIRLSRSRATLQVGKEIQLDVTYRPDDADEDLEIDWTTSNGNVADVDSSGIVTAIGPGVCYIKAKTANRKSAECEIRVPGKVSDEDREWMEEDLDDGYLPTVRLSGKLVLNTLQKNLELVDGDSITLRNVNAVDAATLQDASSTTTYRFSTRSDDRTVGQVTLTPEVVGRLSGEIHPGIYCGTRNLKTMQTSLERYFTSNMKLVRVLQSTYPVPVQYAFDTTGLQPGDIHLYAYDKDANKYSLLNTPLKVDTNGYLRFSSSRGGYFIISEGPLEKK